MSELPPKLFFRIGEVAGLVGVEPHVLRYWEREFRSIRPTKSRKGQRIYSRKDVENLLRVRDLLYRERFTIAGAKQQMQRAGAEPVRDAHEAATARETNADADTEEPTSEEPISAVARVVPALAAETAVAHDGADGEEGAEAPPTLREKLTNLRAEVEAFLDELDRS